MFIIMLLVLLIILVIDSSIVVAEIFQQKNTICGFEATLGGVITIFIVCFMFYKLYILEKHAVM